MSEDLSEKAQAIASVLWLLPDHFSMIRIGRYGVHFINEIEQSDLPSGWRSRIPEEFEGWPLAEIKSWFAYQRQLSRKYRLRAVGRALDRLKTLSDRDTGIPEWRGRYEAVVMECIEGGDFSWYEPHRVSDRCREGLEFMADDVPGEVPWFHEAVVNLGRQARNRRIQEMAAEGIGKKRIARELGCSPHTVKAVLRGHVVRHGRVTSAPGNIPS